MSRVSRAALLIGWIVVIALLGWYVQSSLTISGDLRLFMPSPKTRIEKLLLEEIGESPASRLLLMSLQGAEPEALAESSQAFAAALRDDPGFSLVSNGATSLDAIPDSLLPYRYLLSPTLDTAKLDAPYLREQLSERLQDLSSSAGSVLEPLIPRDPTLEVLKLAEAWQPARQPQKLYDVWFDSAGKSAILVVATKGAAFDPNGQEQAAAAIRKHFEETRTDPKITLITSGPGAFSVLMKNKTQTEATWIGTFDTIGVILLMLITYRSVSTTVLGILPIASAGVASLAAVSAIFGSIHGITLGFGATLLGVAQDYPMHLFSHRHAGKSPLDTARSVWPTLATGVVSTCIAYLAFFFSGVTGLAQLACFTIAGLAVAGVTTRYLLPRVMPLKARDYGQARWLDTVWSSIVALPRPLWLGAVVMLACVAVIVFGKTPMWENELGRLTPVPQPLLLQDAKLRQELGASDIRRMLVVEAATADEVLTRTEALVPQLEAFVRSGDIENYDDVARYLPSIGVQKRRQAGLPDRETLQASLAEALNGLQFKAGLFEPFLNDVEKARALPPLTAENLAGTPLELRVGGMLLHHGDKWSGLVTFGGVNKSGGLEKIAASSGGAITLLDLKDASEALVARQRVHILWSLAIAAVLLVITVFIALRSPRRMMRVIAPMAVTTLLIIGVLQALGVSLNLFHLIALVLAAGLGIDYALFFESVEEDPEEQRRTLHAVLVCALSTLWVFLLMAFATTPVLSSIGLTVSLGVVSNFVLALLLTRPPRGTPHVRA
ncbi:MAG: MMPL family transporter [Gammaproteobacteria bacterium]